MADSIVARLEQLPKYEARQMNDRQRVYRVDHVLALCRAWQEEQGKESEVNAHMLKLQFRRFLSESEWREVVQVARTVPHVVGLEANAIEIRQEEQGWQPIGSYDKASCPLDVLVATDRGVGEARQHDDGAYGAWFWANTADDGAPGPGQIFPTHWMPLPAPPEPTK